MGWRVMERSEEAELADVGVGYDGPGEVSP